MKRTLIYCGNNEGYAKNLVPNGFELKFVGPDPSKIYEEINSKKSYLPRIAIHQEVPEAANHVKEIKEKRGLLAVLVGRGNSKTLTAA